MEGTTKKPNKKAQIILFIYNSSHILRNNCNIQNCLILPQWNCVEALIWKHHRLYENYMSFLHSKVKVWPVLTNKCSLTCFSKLYTSLSHSVSLLTNSTHLQSTAWGKATPGNEVNVIPTCSLTNSADDLASFVALMLL